MSSESSFSLAPRLNIKTSATSTGSTVRRLSSTKQHQQQQQQQKHQLQSSSSSSSPSHLTLSNVPSLIKVKKEPPEDEIKEYAANAMSELLGWYGYEKVDSRCTRGLNLDHFASLTSPNHHCNHQQSNNRHNNHHHHSHLIESNFTKNNKANSHGVHRQTRVSKSPQSRTSQSPSTSSISVISNRESDVAQVSSPPVSLTTAPASPRALEHSDSASDTPDSSTTCSWCGRTGGTWEPGSGVLSYGISNNSGRFCSEACFAAGRRAAFKRARTCDWCRHVRHSVSYVDFQDGESQLQFCSDKCLNQYKMNIFCRETQAHLALHGLATSLSSKNPNASGGLITPELWLRDCQSSPPPLCEDAEDEALIVDDEPINWPSSASTKKSSNQVEQQTSKDDEEKQLLAESIKMISSAPQQTFNNNFDDTSNDTFNEETEEAIRESLREEEERKMKNSKEEMKSLKPLYTHVESESIQSQCSNKKSSDCTREGTIYLKDVRKLIEKDVEKMRHQISTASYRSGKMFKPPIYHSEQQMNYQSSPTGILGQQRPLLPHPMPIKFFARSGNFSGTPSMTMEPPAPSPPPPPPPPPLHDLHKKISTANSQTGLLPPVTVLVPYPIPIPIPLPIPIPFPLFSKFFNSKNYNFYETKHDINFGASGVSDKNVEVPIIPEDLSQRGKTPSKLQKRRITKNDQSLNPVVDKTVALSDSSTSSSPPIATAAAALLSATTCTPFSSTNVMNDTLPPVLPTIASTNMNSCSNSSSSRNSRSLRKRRRQSVTDHKLQCESSNDDS